MATKRSVRCAFVGIACLLMIACGAPDVAPTGNVADASPEATASLEATEVDATAAPRATDARFPEGHVFSINDQTDTNIPLADLISGAVDTFDLIVIGRVVEALPARWTTPDGLRPTDFYAEMPHPYTIATPYVVELSVPDALRALPGPMIPLNDRAVALLGPVGDRLIVAANGGTVDKDSVIDSTESGLLTVGDKILIFLSMHRVDDSQAPPEQLLPTSAGPGWWAAYRFILNEDGSATIYDRTFPAAEVAQEILPVLSDRPLASPTS